MTSKPSSASFGTAFSTPLNPPQERGKSSYQLPNRARSRSTSTSSGASRVVFPGRSRAPSAGAAVRQSSSVPSPKSAAPSASSPLRSSCSAAIFRSSSSTNVAYGSTHASTVYCQRPSPVTSKAPRQWSLPRNSSGSSSHLRVPSRR